MLNMPSSISQDTIKSYEHIQGLDRTYGWAERSANRSWPTAVGNLLFLKYKGETGDLTALSSDILALQVAGVAQLHQQVENRHFQNNSSYAGLTAISPGHVHTRFTWSGEATLLILILDPAHVMKCATALWKTDPIHVALAHHFSLRDPLVEHICLALHHEIFNDGLGGDIYAESLIQTLVIHLLLNNSTLTPHPTIVQKPKSLTKDQARYIVEFINSHLEHSLTLDDLADVLHMSSVHFRRAFKATMGLAPHQYIIRRRVERAQSLLLSGKFTIAEAAQAVGFADQSHLHHHMKRLLGVTPGILIKKILN